MKAANRRTRLDGHIQSRAEIYGQSAGSDKLLKSDPVAAAHYEAVVSASWDRIPSGQWCGSSMPKMNAEAAPAGQKRKP